VSPTLTGASFVRAGTLFRKRNGPNASLVQFQIMPWSNDQIAEFDVKLGAYSAILSSDARGNPRPTLAHCFFATPLSAVAGNRNPVLGLVEQGSTSEDLERLGSLYRLLLVDFGFPYLDRMSTDEGIRDELLAHAAALGPSGLEHLATLLRAIGPAEPLPEVEARIVRERRARLA